MKRSLQQQQNRGKLDSHITTGPQETFCWKHKKCEMETKTTAQSREQNISNHTN